MKKINLLILHKIIPLLFIALTFGCEEVIDVDLNSADPQIVSEGLLLPDSTAHIRLTYTSDYFDPQEAKFISDAEITLSDNKGTIDTLVHIGAGYYHGKNIIGQENTEYYLKIIKDSKIYECKTFMGEAPKLHSVTVDTFDMGFTFDDEIFREIKINIVKGNHKESPYWIHLYHYAFDYDDEYYIIKERDHDNDTLQYTIISDELEEDDYFGFSVVTIDEPIYDFLRMMNDVMNTNTMSSTAPYNPESNISNGMLGYFGAIVPIEFNIRINTGEYYKNE
jgi:hypothetical protein